MSEDDAKRRLRLVRPGETPPMPDTQPPAARTGMAFPYPPGTFADMFDLSGKVALIVGGGGGLSRAIASAMADFGAQIAVADLNLDAAETTAAACDRGDRQAMAAMLDVTDPDMVEDVVAQIEAQTGHIDILLNGAGITIRKPAVDFTPDDWMAVINTNLSGVFYVTQAVGRGMLQRGYGRILSIGSVSSLLGHPENAPYAAAKGGIAIMTKSFATEWAPYGVTVNAIGPAYTLTELTKNIISAPEVQAKLVSRIPTGRFGLPEDLVGAAVFLCSESARFVTGQTLYIDGGFTAD
ncbi:MAG: SDR family oxidoreductase [Thermomicrobiales bacterium]|nr:SDR family oxidoreductase [Thermomicrobiales bacterium]